MSETPQDRSSRIMRNIWSDPVQRAKRLAAMRAAAEKRRKEKYETSDLEETK